MIFHAHDNAQHLYTVLTKINLVFACKKPIQYNVTSSLKSHLKTAKDHEAAAI